MKYVLAIVFCVLFCASANAQQCVGGVCRVASRVVAAESSHQSRSVVSARPVRRAVRGLAARQPVRSTLRAVFGGRRGCR